MEWLGGKTELKIQDIILNGNIPCWVESIGKNHVQATDMYSFETVTIIPHSTSIGMYCYTKLFSMLSLLGITKEKLSISDVLPWIVIADAPALSIILAASTATIFS